MVSANPPSAEGATQLPALLQQALRLHKEEKYPEAAVLYQAILDQDPGHFDALHLQGVIAAQSGDPARALEFIGRALAVDSGHAVVHYNYALALRDLGRGADALAEFDTVLEMDPAHADAWISRAEILQDLRRTGEAIDSYARALALTPENAQAWFARGIQQQYLQRHAGALADYDRVLALQPNFIGALHNRGSVLRALQRHADALDNYDRLLTLTPEYAPAHHGRGLALEGLGRHVEALACHDRALALRPDLEEAHLQRGRVLRQLGRTSEALAEYEQLLATAPAHPDALFEQGSLLQALGRVAAALECYDRALAARPTFAEACNNRALVLLDLRRPAEALAACERAIEIEPGFAEAWANRGLVLASPLGRYDEALESYARALALRPAYAEAWANRGHVLQELQRLEESLESYDRALTLESHNPEYLCGRGTLLHLLDRPLEALACYDQALLEQPGHTKVLANRGGVLESLHRHAEAAECFAHLLQIEPDYPYARGNRLHAQLHACDWRDYARSSAALEAAVTAGKPADMPFAFLSVSQSAAAQLQCARQRAASAYPPAAAPLWKGTIYRHQRVRLAYVSGDLRAHAVAVLMAELLECHERKRFELIAISLRPAAPDPFGRRVAAAFERFVDVSMRSDLQVARLMHEMEIDIAVDLMGYTNLPRTGIFAHRPAPIQAGYLGFAGTMATGYTDYLIADAVTVPEAAARHYAEMVVRLPAGFMPRDTTVMPAAPPTRAAAGLPERGFVFCCFNNAYKFNPPVFAVWMRLLRAVPGSVLWLTAPGADAQPRLLDEARQHGVAPERIVFAIKTHGIEEHLGRIALADLFLDTLPYNAHATASDALWAGVPLLTCTGEAFASRVAASLLGAAGLPELITGSLAEYEALALRLANAPAQLAGLRARLAQRHSAGTLFNTGRVCRQLESAYITMHERQQRGLPPAAFNVPE